MKLKMLTWLTPPPNWSPAKKSSLTLCLHHLLPHPSRPTNQRKRKTKLTLTQHVSIQRLSLEPSLPSDPAFLTTPLKPSSSSLFTPLKSCHLRTRLKSPPSAAFRTARTCPPRKPDSLISFADMIKNSSSPSPSPAHKPSPP